MKQLSYSLLLIIFAFACQQSESTDNQVITEVGPWQDIFNGKDLTGWETMGKLETSFKDGALHIHATHPNNNAWIYTKKDYKNFKLEAEFIMADSATNSGILFRFDPRKRGIPNALAYEANIDWGINHQNVMGTLENAARASAIPEVNIADWQKMRIEAKGTYLQVYFNDKLICETNNQRAVDGRIALQVPINQGGDIAFRNIKVQQLPDAMPSKPLLEEAYREATNPFINMLEDPTLKDWSQKGPGTWNFDGEVLHGNSGASHSYLVTNKTYKNYYLKCKFKIKFADNSGIFIRHPLDSMEVSANEAIECNIYDHNGYAHVFSTGSIVFHARAFSKLINHEEWNEMEIFTKNEHLILTINGNKSAETYLPKKFDRAGAICLQAGTRVFSDDGPSDIYFKELMIREME